jgi:hypothetical protein
MIEVKKINGQHFAFPVDKYGFSPAREYWVAGDDRDDAIKKAIAIYNAHPVKVES